MFWNKKKEPREFKENFYVGLPVLNGGKQFFPVKSRWEIEGPQDTASMMTSNLTMKTIYYADSLELAERKISELTTPSER